MATARHARRGTRSVSIDQIIERYVARFSDRRPTGPPLRTPRSRVQTGAASLHRAGGSGKHDDTSAISGRQFHALIMFVPPGQGNAAHTHEAEEVFFVLQVT